MWEGEKNYILGKSLHDDSGRIGLDPDPLQLEASNSNLRDIAVLLPGCSFLENIKHP